MLAEKLNLSEEDRTALLELAYKSVFFGVTRGETLSIMADEYPETLRQLRATFVTLHLEEELRGCIGVTSAFRPLVEDVVENAYAAAFRDTRFDPLTDKELDELEIDISILSEAEPIEFSSEEDLLAKIRPGIDGLTIEEGAKKGSFLPAMWQHISEPDGFLSRLKIKAGLPEDYWSKEISVWRYTTETIP